MCDFSRMQHNFINRRTDALLAVLLAYLRFQQKAFFADIMTIEYISKLLMGVVRVEIGQETQVAAIDTNDLNIVARQRSCGTQHVAVTADHDREIGLLSDFRQRAGFHIFEL
ncbi:hypothetical protein D3C87_1585840 [compost metagenome]